MTTIMLTGKNGQLGWELQRTLHTSGKIVAFDHAMLDLADHPRLRKTIREVKPDLIVNAAAYTAVDQAEKDPDLAIAINATAPQIMAEEASSIGAALIHYSTDYVFNGNKPGAYVEDDRTDPLNVYGKSKLLGEQAIEAMDIPYFIFRTSWVYAARGHNFVRTMLRLMQELDCLNIVSDQYGSPTWSRSIAEVTSQILSKVNAVDGLNISAIKELRGIYHLTSSGRTSWYDFANSIFANSLELEHRRENLRIKGIPTSEYPAPAKRPHNSELSTAKISTTFGITLPDWQDSLKLCLDDIAAVTH